MTKTKAHGHGAVRLPNSDQYKCRSCGEYLGALFVKKPASEWFNVLGVTANASYVSRQVIGEEADALETLRDWAGRIHLLAGFIKMTSGGDDRPAREFRIETDGRLTEVTR